jgi:ribosomal protein S18 acetylase RimI-like enzyme
MVVIRPLQPDDEPFQWDMGWEATSMNAEARAAGRDTAISLPQVRRNLVDFGRPGDGGVVAVTADGARLGVAWYRLFSAEEPGWGFIAVDVPELAIGVAAEARGRGIGGALLDALLALAREQGFRALSLAVDHQNAATRRLYERKGFRDAAISDPTDSGVTMVADL